MNAKMRASSFAVFGALSNYGIGELKEAFVEQVYNSVSSIVKKSVTMCNIVTCTCDVFNQVTSIFMELSHYFGESHTWW